MSPSVFDRTMQKHGPMMETIRGNIIRKPCHHQFSIDQMMRIPGPEVNFLIRSDIWTHTAHAERADFMIRALFSKHLHRECTHTERTVQVMAISSRSEFLQIVGSYVTLALTTYVVPELDSKALKKAYLPKRQPQANAKAHRPERRIIDGEKDTILLSFFDIIAEPL
ncbi:hypothetical protein KIN20_018101 [Parelaphostrongylus tenuis]|uniref:Uncharacterized protein n=1 Tax=Parelaphostrongylus tenuis TaxID=148309 RepID=A0AAD5MJF6_PARTN|nr:hypothetical protein KIN20_018101 [Parelaphostrongylus tenuis]